MGVSELAKLACGSFGVFWHLRNSENLQVPVSPSSEDTFPNLLGAGACFTQKRLTLNLKPYTFRQLCMQPQCRTPMREPYTVPG